MVLLAIKLPRFLLPSNRNHPPASTDFAGSGAPQDSAGFYVIVSWLGYFANRKAANLFPQRDFWQMHKEPSCCPLTKNSRKPKKQTTKKETPTKTKTLEGCRLGSWTFPEGFGCCVCSCCICVCLLFFGSSFFSRWHCFVAFIFIRVVLYFSFPRGCWCLRLFAVFFSFSLRFCGLDCSHTL